MEEKVDKLETEEEEWKKEQNKLEDILIKQKNEIKANETKKLKTEERNKK